MYLLDTNVISEIRKNKPHGAVVAWLRTVERGALSVAAISLGEIQSGIELIRRGDPVKADEIEEWLNSLPQTFRVISLGEMEFREWAKLIAGRGQQYWADALIAATARVRRLTVVTRNTDDFKLFDVPVFNPFLFR